MSGQLFKSTAVVGSMTLLSRLLGFVRDMLIARLFGVDPATDAFFVAFKIPNFLRRLFAEGAFAHVFVPIIAEAKRQDNPLALKTLIDKTSGTLSLWLALFTLIGMITAPVLIWLLAPGFAWQGDQHALSVQLLQITLPYLLFIVLVAFAGGILNAHDRFAISALTPIFLNVCMIATAVWLAPRLEEPVTALAWGVLLAGAVQLLFQLPGLAALGLIPRLRVDFQDPAVKRILKHMLPAIFSVSVTQINLLLDTLVASFLTVGSVSWLYYSDRLVEFPLGILGLALGTVILPNLAKHHASEDPAGFANALDWGLRLAVLVGVPATIGLIFLAEPMLSTLFQYSEFTAADVVMSGQSLKAYAVGLLGYLLIKVLVPGFSARQDMHTPVRYGVYAMLASLGLNVALVFPLAHAGLALATSLGAFFNAALLLLKLRKEKIYQPASGWLLFGSRILLASLAMSAMLYFWVDVTWWQHWESPTRVLHLFKWIVLGILVYAATLLLSGLRPKHLGY
ncbi:murein biosynthesis integral membrane protein MurJ [Methylosoma difficile]